MLSSYAVRLAQKHEEIDGLTWAVVTDEEVYNEFSSGTPDASAYLKEGVAADDEVPLTSHLLAVYLPAGKMVSLM